MGNHYISVAALLLSLTGGMLLLAKTKKDSLSMFFNVISWGIIAISLLGLLGSGVRCISKCGHKSNCQKNTEMMHDGGCSMKQGQCHEERVIMKKMGHAGMGCGRNEGCAMPEKGCGHQMDCCAEGKEKKVCVKDSVVIKK